MTSKEEILSIDSKTKTTTTTTTEEKTGAHRKSGRRVSTCKTHSHVDPIAVSFTLTKFEKK